MAVAHAVKPGMHMAFCSRDVKSAKADLLRIVTEIREHLEPQEAVPAIALADGGTGATAGLASNYALPTLNASNAPVTISARALTLTGTTVDSRAYDGTTVATLSGGTLGNVVSGDTLVLTQTGTFASKDVGSRAVTATSTFSVGSTTSGSVQGDYAITAPTGLTGTITKKVLTVTANNDAKFYGLADASGYYGVSYAGFVSGESATNLTTSPTVTRSNSSTQTAGSYTGVLVPAGAAATNYSFTYVNGNYTIDRKSVV